MRLHHVTITPRSVTIDGIPLTVRENGPTIEPIGLDMSIVHIPVIASTAIISGDTHDPDEPTPTYDQLIAETKARTSADTIRRTRAQHVAEAIRRDRA